MVKVAVLASFNMDLVMRAERRPGRGETLQGDFAMHLGGKGFNQAVAARRLGADVAVAGGVGDDEFGRMFLDALDREAIDRRAVIVEPTAGTGVASIIVEVDGTNSIVQAPRANRHVRAVDAASGDLLSGAGIALLQLETSGAGATAFADAARRNGIPVLLNAAPAGMAHGPLLMKLTDVLVVNEIEASALLGTASGARSPAGDEEAAACELRRGGPRTVAITLGERGVVAADASGTVRAPAYEVSVVDTTGAGDAFCAALAVALAEGGALSDALRFASAAGALACTRAGAEPSMPHRDDVEALLRTGLLGQQERPR